MKFNYNLHRLCGSYYGHPSSTSTNSHVGSQWGGTNLLYTSSGDVVVSGVSNRIQVVDLKTQSVRTLPVEARSNITRIAMSPIEDSSLLVIIDTQNYVMIVNFIRGIVLHRMKSNKKIRDCKFSPCGKFIAFTYGKHIRVWRAPDLSQKQFCPMSLHRTYTGLSDDVVFIDWSSDSSVLLGGSRDSTVKIWTLHTTQSFEPVTISGHRTAIVGAFFGTYSNNKNNKCNRIETIYTISQDGTLVSWNCDYDDSNDQMPINNTPIDVDESVSFFTGGNVSGSSSNKSKTYSSLETQGHAIVNGTWSVGSRHYFGQEGTTVTSVDYCLSNQLLAVAFSSGVFGLYEMPSVSNIHTLSVGGGTGAGEGKGGHPIKTIVLNKTGDWIGIGCPTLQQLVVWEWRSETYVIKQRGHSYGTMACMSYSPDGIVIATGGNDGKIKLWNATSGFCYVTMEKSHTAPVTAIAFAKSSVVVSASFDGTVKAHDLYRYRTFKTLTTPVPTQFISLATSNGHSTGGGNDGNAGELVMAGSNDFKVYVWNLRTSRLLDIYSGHTGPVCALDFCPVTSTLSSGSWDGTVRMWEIYKTNSDNATETLKHTADVVCLAMRPTDGAEVCVGTTNGMLSFWDVENGKIKHEIDGRRDIAGGRKMDDRSTADNNASSKYFTSVAYSANGEFLLAGGNSKFVCIYAIETQILLKKFQVTFNRSLDGVLDELNSKNLSSGAVVPVDAEGEDASGDETTYNTIRLPGAKVSDDGSRKSRVEVLTLQVAFSSTGREWSTISGEGLHVYGLDDDMVFDPIKLTESITPAAVESRLRSGQYGEALVMAIRLNEYSLVCNVLENTPHESITYVVSSASLCGGGRQPGTNFLERLLQFLAKTMIDTPHIEFYLEWVLQLLKHHGRYIDQNRSIFMRSFRALFKVIQIRQKDISTLCIENKYNLQYIMDQTKMNNEPVKDGNNSEANDTIMRD